MRAFVQQSKQFCLRSKFFLARRFKLQEDNLRQIDGRTQYYAY